MPSPALRPRSATEIVDASFQLFRAHAAPFIIGAAIAYVPILVLQLIVLGDPSQYTVTNGIAGATPLSTYWFVSMGTGLLAYTFMGSVLTVLASQAYLGEPVDVSAAVRRAGPRLLPVLVASVIIWLAVVIGMVFLIFPGIYLALRFFAATPAIVLEGHGPGSALSRSAALSKGRKWHLFVTICIVFVIYMLIAFGVSFITTLLGGFLLQTLASALLTVMLFPVLTITFVLLYYDARIQSEGLDLELMADSLGGASPAV